MTTDRAASRRHEAVVNDLKGRVRGPLLRPGRARIRRGALGLERDDRPAAGARSCAASASPTSSPCVNAAREHGLPLSIKGGGHNIAGLAVCEGGLMLDMSLMRGVWVDPARARRARAGRLPARRRRPRDAAARPGRGARVRVQHRLRGADARRRLRLPHAPVRLDQRQPRVDRSRHRRRPGASAPPSARTATCSGGCAAAAATSASPPASSTSFTRSVRTSSRGAIAWRGEEAAGVLEMYRVARGRARPAS